MIAYDLRCGAAHQFEGWFASSSDYDRQNGLGMIACPVCEDTAVTKAPSAPYVGRKSNQAASAVISEPVAERAQDIVSVANAPVISQAVIEIVEKLTALQSEVLKDSVWVGRDFAEEARAIHYGESEGRMIHGEASPDEAQDLIEEGIEVSALPMPYIPPLAKN